MASSEQSNQKYIQEYVGPCPYCGFHLQQLNKSICSECGNTLEITLKAPFKLTGWFLMFVGLCSTIAIYLNHVFSHLIGAYASGGRVMVEILVPEILVVLTLSVFAFVWFHVYQWFFVRKIITKWIAGTIGCLLPFVMFYVMFEIIRAS